MKIIDGIEFISVDDNMMGVSTGDANDIYRGIINLNKTAYKIWKYIEDGMNYDEIADRLSEEYADLGYDEAMQYIHEFTDKLIEKGILIED